MTIEDNQSTPPRPLQEQRLYPTQKSSMVPKPDAGAPSAQDALEELLGEVWRQEDWQRQEEHIDRAVWLNYPGDRSADSKEV